MNFLLNFLFVFFLILNNVFAGTCTESNTAKIFITKEGQLQEGVIRLLRLDNLYDPQDNFKMVVRKTQEHWLQSVRGKGNKERTDYVDTERQIKNRVEVLQIAMDMHLLEERSPHFLHYEYGVVLGAFLDGVRLRLYELVKAWEKGYRFDSIVFLTGSRDLRKGEGDQEEIEKLLNPAFSLIPFKKGWKLPENFVYETEFDMAKLVWDQTQIPEDMAKALEGKVLFVNAPKVNGLRPNTYDTYKTWLQEYNPAPGKILAPSYPLLWVYQQLVGENALCGKGFLIDTTAPSLSSKEIERRKNSIVSLIQDTVAKSLYEISKSKEL